MKYIVIFLLTLIALVLLAGFLLAVEAVQAKPNAAAPVPTCGTFDPASAPAYPEVRRWALFYRAAAVRQWERWNALRSDAFAYPLVPFHRHSARRPPLSATGFVWTRAGLEWRRDRDDYLSRYRKLWRYMTAPGGSGWERWTPLLRYTWPHYLVPTAVQVIRYESGGAPYRYNSAGSGAFGLMQLLPRPAGVWSPLSQLRYAYWRKYVPAGGWSPWSSCAAF